MYNKLSGLISILIVGCTNSTSQEDVLGDDVFLENFEVSINKRWVEGDKIVVTNDYIEKSKANMGLNASIYNKW